MKKLTKLMLATSALISSFAFAGHDSARQTISFEDFRTACLNPARFHNQIAPTNIQVTCRDGQYKWVPDATGSQYLDTSRTVTTSVISDKYMSDSVTGAVRSDPQTIGCPAYKQVYESVEVARAVTCDEIVSFKGTGTEFCLKALNSLKAANPESITVQATGQSINLCEGGAVQQGQQGHRK